MHTHMRTDYDHNYNNNVKTYGKFATLIFKNYVFSFCHEVHDNTNRVVKLVFPESLDIPLSNRNILSCNFILGSGIDSIKLNATHKLGRVLNKRQNLVSL